MKEADRLRLLRRRITELFEALHEPVYRYVFGVLRDESEAEEIMQEAFLALYRQFCQGKEVEDPKPWVFRVAHNLAIDRRRCKAREDQFQARAWWDHEVLESASGKDIRETLLRREQKARVRKAVAALAPQQRRCIELRVEGLTYRQIAGVLGLAVSSVQNHLARAIRRIQTELGL